VGPAPRSVAAVKRTRLGERKRAAAAAGLTLVAAAALARASALVWRCDVDDQVVPVRDIFDGRHIVGRLETIDGLLLTRCGVVHLGRQGPL